MGKDFHSSIFERGEKGEYMAGKRVVDIASDICTPIITQLGYELVDLEYKKMHDGYHLIFTIDKPNGVDINDCETVHRAIDEPLDTADPTKGAAYHLDVSSCGLDRPLTTEYLLNKYKGEEVEVKFYKLQQIFGTKCVTGKLLSWNEDSVTIEVVGQNESVTLQKSMIAQIVPVIKF